MTRATSTVRGLNGRILREELDRAFALDPHVRTRLEPPAGGWLKSIRTALGMTAKQLGQRVGVSQVSVTLAEAAEADERITLKTLRKVARGLDCDLVYGLVPRTSLDTMVHNRANATARRMVDEIRHGMTLEGQSTDREAGEREVTELREGLVARGSSRIWDASE